MWVDVDKFLQRTPFFRLLLPFIAGILCQSHINNFVSYGILFIGILLILCDFIPKNINLVFRTRWLFGTGVFLVIFFTGLFVTQKADEQSSFMYSGKQRIYHCEILSVPVEKPKTVQCNIKVLHDSISLTSKAIVYLQKDSTSLMLMPGDRLLINAKLSNLLPPKNPDEFNYARFLKHKGISGTAYVSSVNWCKLNHTGKAPVTRLAAQCRNKLLSIYRKLSVSGNEFAVLSAMTLGYKDVMPDELYDSFKTAGVVHILAISGLHVGFVYLILIFLFSFLDKNTGSRILKSILIILLLWLYAFITGLAPSVVRATIMLSLVAFAAIFRRRSQVYNAVFLSAFGMLLYNPYYLFDVGFQLSYAAVLAILFFQPRLYSLLPVKNKITAYLWSLFTVSLAAQLGTTPIVLYYFHQFPNYFWLANMLIVPLAGIIIYAAFFLLLIHWIPLLSNLAAYALSFIVKVFNAIVEFIARLPYSTTNSVWLESYHVIGLFLVIFLIAIAFMYRKFMPIIAATSLITLMLIADITLHYPSRNADKLVVAAMPKGYGVSFMTRKHSYILSNNPAEEKRALNNFRMHSGIRYETLMNDSYHWYNKDGFISFGSKKILVLSENIFYNKISNKPIELDYVILVNNVSIAIPELLTFVNPRQVIIDKSFSKKKQEKLKDEFRLHSIPAYFVADEGAFVEMLQK